MKVLVTGGTGYLGSHTTVELINHGDEVTIIDNLSNSCVGVLDRIEEITGRRPNFYEIDIRDRESLDRLFSEHEFDVCIHFAGLKSVPVSTAEPLAYYRNNVTGTITLLEAMESAGLRNIIFSSSATVYGVPPFSPVTEECPKGSPAHPYGWTKSMIEQILTDLQKASPEWNVVILRYFNPIGAHKSGRIGDSPSGVPNNLMPYITQVAVGERDHLNLYGTDYNTPDGTNVRDYVHVLDLVKGHVLALRKIEEKAGLCIYNLGTGKGTSTLEVIKAFEKANNLKIPYVEAGRRPGDIDEYYADIKKAQRELGYSAEYSIEDMCRDAYNWQKNNPKGYV